LLGYVYTTQLQKGRDIGAWFEKLVDSIVSLFSKKEKTPFKKVYKNKNYSSSKSKSSKTTHHTAGAKEKQQKIDAILDKISKSGYESLSKAEKDFLFNAGKD